MPLIFFLISEKYLMLKILDSDYPQHDELIGKIRLPLSGLNLTSSSRQHTCLILHEKKKRYISAGEESDFLGPNDAAKLNLKISQQAEENYELNVKLKETSDKLEAMQAEFSALKSEKIQLEMDNLRFERTDEDENSEDFENRLSICSAPTSQGSSPSVTRREPEDKESKSFRLLSHLQSTLTDKDREINNLRQHIKDLRPKLELLSSRNGQIDLGMSYYHITSRLRVDVYSAHNLRAVNLYGKDSDPFVKIRIYKQNEGGKVQKWKFQTSIVWKTVSPVWNEKYSKLLILYTLHQSLYSILRQSLQRSKVYGFQLPIGGKFLQILQ